MEELLKKEMECHASDNFEEYEECIAELNEMIKEILTSKFGYKGRSCDSREFRDKKLGIFLYKTLTGVGLNLDDIKDIILDCDNRRNVMGIETKGGKKIWVKSSGTHGSISVDEILYTKEVDSIGKIIGEDVPIVINDDVKNRIIALSDIRGKPVYEDGYWERFSPTELATNILFEIILMDADRVRDNVIREDGIIKELDFGAITNVDTLEEWRQMKTSNQVVKGFFRWMDSVIKGEKISKRGELYLKNFIQAMREKMNEYRENEDLIRLSAPYIYRHHKERVDNILKELSEYLDKIEERIKGE